MDGRFREHPSLPGHLYALLAVIVLACSAGAPAQQSVPPLAIVDDALRATSDYHERRADELAALTHPSVRELIAAEGIELVSFRWLVQRGGAA